MSAARAALAICCALGCGSPTTSEPTPARTAPSPVMTPFFLRYLPTEDQWERAPDARSTGLYWVLQLRDGVLDQDLPGRFEQVGPGCGPFDLGAPQPGRVALCVPQADHAEPRFIAAPPAEEGLLPLCGHPPRGVCRGVRADVRSEMTPPMSDADLAAIRAAWGDFLIAMGEGDDAALMRACATIGIPNQPYPGSLAPFGSGNERAHTAVRFDEAGLVLYRLDEERRVIAGLEGDRAVGAIGLLFYQGPNGAWVLCGVDTGG